MTMGNGSTLSIVRGASTPALLQTCIGAALKDAAKRWPEHDALVVRHQDVRWSFTELDAKTDDLAAQLLDLGLEPGDRVGIWSQNSAEWTLTQFATAKAGLIQVNVNPAYRTSELEHALNLSGCRALILAPSFRSSNYIAMLRELAPELLDAKPGELHAARIPALRWVICTDEAPVAGMLRFADLTSSPSTAAFERLAAVSPTLRPSDPINIQFTSGTTGAPKGATLTHRNILNNGYFVGRRIEMKAGDRLCIPVPLYHCFGMVMANLACITHGACMVQPAEYFTPGSSLEAVEEESCTILYGVPTMFIAMLEHPHFGSFDLSTLRTGIMAGAPCPIEVMRKVIERMHMRGVTIAYGMTETSPVSFQSDGSDPIEKRVSTVGRLEPHLEARIVGPDGCVVQRGEPGEIHVRGYSVMHGYWDDEPGTACAIDREGWMHTGDLGSIDVDGYCQILGRSKDMIIRGGENIYPAEVEQFLFRHPGIRDVQCVGVPDKKYGEELCACVLLQDGEQLTIDELKTFCADQISHYKVPRYLHVMNEFPLTVTGKVQKFVLRDIVSRALQL